jgi:hypothetical protein
LQAAAFRYLQFLFGFSRTVRFRTISASVLPQVEDQPQPNDGSAANPQKPTVPLSPPKPVADLALHQAAMDILLKSGVKGIVDQARYEGEWERRRAQGSFAWQRGSSRAGTSSP